MEYCKLEFYKDKYSVIPVLFLMINHLREGLYPFNVLYITDSFLDNSVLKFFKKNYKIVHRFDKDKPMDIDFVYRCFNKDFSFNRERIMDLSQDLAVYRQRKIGILCLVHPSVDMRPFKNKFSIIIHDKEFTRLYD